MNFKEMKIKCREAVTRLSSWYTRALSQEQDWLNFPLFPRLRQGQYFYFAWRKMGVNLEYIGKIRFYPVTTF